MTDGIKFNLKANAEAAESLLEAIKARITQIAYNDEATWGSVGDLSHVTVELTGIAQFLGIEVEA
jgi:hypothetical protein